MPEKRYMLYSEGCTEGMIFVGEEAMEKALKDGWQDTPLPTEQVAQESNDSEVDSLIDDLKDEIDALEEALEAATGRANSAEEELDLVKQAVAGLSSTSKEVKELQAALKETANESN